MKKQATRYAAYAFAASLALGMTAPAFADGHDDHDRDGRDRDRHEREWRDHEAREHYYRAPPVVYEQPRVYYPPPPLVVGVPGLSIIVR